MTYRAVTQVAFLYLLHSTACWKLQRCNTFFVPPHIKHRTDADSYGALLSCQELENILISHCLRGLSACYALRNAIFSMRVPGVGVEVAPRPRFHMCANPPPIKEFVLKSSQKDKKKKKSWETIGSGPSYPFFTNRSIYVFSFFLMSLNVDILRFAEKKTYIYIYKIKLIPMRKLSKRRVPNI